MKPILSLASRLLLILAAALGCLLACVNVPAASAQTGLNETAPEVVPEMTRDEWRARVAAAKERAQQFRAERRYLIEPAPEDLERLASERALSDDSLQKGDIVSTGRGLMVFQGRSPGDEGRNIFTPYP